MAALKAAEEAAAAAHRKALDSARAEAAAAAAQAKDATDRQMMLDFIRRALRSKPGACAQGSHARLRASICGRHCCAPHWSHS